MVLEAPPLAAFPTFEAVRRRYADAGSFQLAMGFCPRELGRVPAPLLDGRGYVEPAEAGGNEEPVDPATSVASPPATRVVRAVFVVGAR